jgi:hypothetical protein
MATQTKRRLAWRPGIRDGLAMVMAVMSLSLFPGCGGGGGPTCEAQIQTSWEIFENGNPVECVRGDTVTIRVDTDSMIMSFDCSAHTGTTPVLQGGVTHGVALQLTDINGTVLSQTPTMSLFVPCGTVTQTPPVQFDVP